MGLKLSRLPSPVSRLPSVVFTLAAAGVSACHVRPLPSMSLTYNNRVALVTGAGRGIGKSIAELLANNGVNVICVSKSADSCGATAAAITAAGGKAKALAVDVAEGAAVTKASADLLAEYGQIDILVNNAGITKDGLLFRMS